MQWKQTKMVMKRTKILDAQLCCWIRADDGASILLVLISDHTTMDSRDNLSMYIIGWLPKVDKRIVEKLENKREEEDQLIIIAKREGNKRRSMDRLILCLCFLVFIS